MFNYNLEYNLFTVDLLISFLDIFGSSSKSVRLLLKTIIEAISPMVKSIFVSTVIEGSSLTMVFPKTYV